MTTSAAKHLQTLRDIAFRRISLNEVARAYPHQQPFTLTWGNVIDAMQALKLPDGSAAIASMQYGVKLDTGVFGSYRSENRHIDIAASTLTERSLATCLHEMVHALLHYDVSVKCYAENEGWLEAEADTAADLILMLMGFAPRRSTQWAMTNLGNVGDVAAFFHFAGVTLVEAANTIHATWQRRAAWVA